MSSPSYEEVRERKLKMIYKYRDWYISEIKKFASTPEAAEYDKKAIEEQKRIRENDEKHIRENGGRLVFTMPYECIIKTYDETIERIKKIFKDNEIDILCGLAYNASQDEVNKRCSSRIYTDICSNKFPPEVREFVKQEFDKRYYIMLSPIDKEGYKMAKELDKMKKDPYEKVGFAELNRRYQAQHEPKTSLTKEQIAHFDRMSTSSLASWCKFSMNWYWVAPCMFLCLFVNKGLIAFIGLLAFMIIGSIYAAYVQEYCSVVLPWYEASGKTIEKRYLKK